MNDMDEKGQTVPTALARAMELADDLERFPLGKCGPSDDLDEQTAYLYAFLDVARPFVAAIKRIGDPDLSEQVSGLVLDIGEITEAYTLKADLQGVIDHLREVAADPTYGASVMAVTRRGRERGQGSRCSSSASAKRRALDGASFARAIKRSCR